MTIERLTQIRDRVVFTTNYKQRIIASDISDGTLSYYEKILCFYYQGFEVTNGKN